MIVVAPVLDQRKLQAFEFTRGVYDARRAAALSGVPMRTLNYWAEHGFYRPSVAPDPKPRLWSWYDLVALRLIDWLRKPSGDLKRVPFARIRDMLDEIDHRGLPRTDLHDLVVRTAEGRLFLEIPHGLVRADQTGQLALPGTLAVVRAYKTGPDLLEPRPLLRIVPGKLSGEPHLQGTRISSQTIYSLQTDGYSLSQIQAMYPDASEPALLQAIDLEASLNAHAA